MGRPLLAERDAIYGVDFSGARDAERKIWLARGLPADGSLHIETCQPLSELQPIIKGPRRAAEALVDLIRRQPRAAFALDFPFGLPSVLTGGLLAPRATWQGFIRDFQKTFPSPETFRESCRAASPLGELRRATDAAARTPFSPYNLRLFRQTWLGIVQVLAPLRDTACVPPMQPLQPDKPWLLEICPASTLKQMGLYRRFPRYKLPGEESRGVRKGILDAIGAAGPLTFARGVKRGILANSGGDALDSVIAALTAFKLLQAPRLPEIPQLVRANALREAWVYCWPPERPEP